MTTFTIFDNKFKCIPCNESQHQKYNNINNLFNFVDFINIDKNKDITILDIGSNIGIYSLAFANIFKKSVIYSFEPNYNTYKKLCDNIKINTNLSCRVKCFNLGLSNNFGKNNIGLPDNIFYNKYSFSNKKNNSELYSIYGTKNVITINVDLLDNFVKNNNLTKIDFIKIDVEGSEFNVLKGGINTIKKFRPIIFMELNELTKNLSNIDCDELYKYFTNLNYIIYPYEYGYKLNKTELKHLNDNNKYSDILCIPR